MLGLLLLCRGGPVLVLYRGILDRRPRRALALLTSTTLPLVVVVTALGVQSGRLFAALAAAMVAAGLLSVLLHPTAGLRLGRYPAAAYRRHTPPS